MHMGGMSDPLSKCLNESDKSKCSGKNTFSDRKSCDTLISQ